MSLIFLHIPKNGGKTINSILSAFYPISKSFLVTEVTPEESNLQEFLDLTETDKADLELLRGHFYYGVHQSIPKRSQYFTFLRNPEERIISFYYFVLRQPNHRLYNDVKDLSLDEFVKNIHPHDLNNAQIRFISGIDDSEENMLERALKNIKKDFCFVGTVEKYDESLLILRKKLGWPYPFYTIRNKRGGGKAKTKISEKTLQLIRDNNEGDTKLYNIITERLENEMEMSSRFKVHLKIFKLLNKIYSLKNGKKLIKKLYLTKASITYKRKFAGKLSGDI